VSIRKKKKHTKQISTKREEKSKRSLKRADDGVKRGWCKEGVKTTPGFLFFASKT
jgi:hypothetical protein